MFLEFGIWFLWLFGGLLGRREIDVFFRTKLCHFKIISSTVLGYCIVGVSAQW